MSQSILTEIANRYRQNQDNRLALVGGLTA